MNNKIYELAKQAGLIEFETIPGSNAVTPDYESVVKAKKFAELIVKECAVYCEGHVLPKGMAEENGLNYNDGVRDCAIGLILELKNDQS